MVNDDREIHEEKKRDYIEIEGEDEKDNCWR